jgi:hypothetical protein
MENQDSGTTQNRQVFKMAKLVYLGSQNLFFIILGVF